MTQTDLSNLSPARCKQLAKLSNRVAETSDKTSARQMARLRKAAYEFAVSTGHQVEEIGKVVGLTIPEPVGRGGKRPGSGRKPRDWERVIGSFEGVSQHRRRGLFEMKFNLVIERALYLSKSASLKSAFEHLILRRAAARELYPSDDLDVAYDQKIAQLIACPDFRRKVTAGKSLTWTAYRHALINPPGGVYEAAMQRANARRAASRLRSGIHPCTGRSLTA